jgi:hypothetical protein
VFGAFDGGFQKIYAPVPRTAVHDTRSIIASRRVGHWRVDSTGL